MFLIIYGEDTFRSRRALRSAWDRFLKERDPSGLNVTRLTAADGLIRAQEELFASPFLAERRLVALEGFCGLPKKDQETAVGLLSRLPESTVAMFFESVGREHLAKSPLFAELAGQPFSQEFRGLNPAEAMRLAVSVAAETGAAFAPRAAGRLAEAVGADSWRISQETAKLANRAAADGRREITLRDIEEMVSESRTESVFAYLDACTGASAERAQTALERLFNSGEHELQVIAALERHFRLIAMAKDLLDRNVSPAEAAGRLNAHPFAAKKALGVAARMRATEIAAILRRLAELEQGGKSGRPGIRAEIGLLTARTVAAACPPQRK